MTKPGVTSAPVLLLAMLLAAGLLSACGGEKETTKAEKSPSEVLTTAKAELDEASSWRLSMSTTSVPESGDAVLAADGVGTHAPAWKGEVKVLFGGLNATVPVVAVDGKVFAKLPLTPSYAPIKVSDFNAPDPADFMDPDIGVSSLLADIDGLEKTGQRRSGSQVLTTYEGTLPGARVVTIIPSAARSGTYPVVVGINPAGQVSTVSVTGTFFKASGDVTYDLEISDYGQDVKITAP